MAQRLPPLAALRPFEAAARLESFSKAADELHLTHGAVSHQVRALEEHLGTALFHRHGKRVTLTQEGRVFAERIRDRRDRGEDGRRIRADGDRDRKRFFAFQRMVAEIECASAMRQPAHDEAIRADRKSATSNALSPKAA